MDVVPGSEMIRDRLNPGTPVEPSAVEAAIAEPPPAISLAMGDVPNMPGEFHTASLHAFADPSEFNHNRY
jgi:hypothetical protein